MKRYKVLVKIDCDVWEVYNGFVESSFTAIKIYYQTQQQAYFLAQFDKDDCTVCVLRRL